MLHPGRYTHIYIYIRNTPTPPHISSNPRHQATGTHQVGQVREQVLDVEERALLQQGQRLGHADLLHLSCVLCVVWGLLGWIGWVGGGTRPGWLRATL